MLNQLDTYDWKSVFGEDESTHHNCPPLQPQPQPPSYKGSTATFVREDVEEIFHIAEGVHDEEEWVVCGRLKDGRFFVARGGCDYTGWDCRATNSADVAATKDDIIRFGLADEERARLGIVL